MFVQGGLSYLIFLKHPVLTCRKQWQVEGSYWGLGDSICTQIESCLQACISMNVNQCREPSTMILG